MGIFNPLAPRGCWGGCNCPRPGYKEWKMNGAFNQIEAYPANLRLESAYKAYYPNNAVLGDSDLLYGNFGTMPAKGSLPSSEWKFFQDEFLPAFRGVFNRLRPDILDFTSKRMYEIKTEANREDGYHQIVSDYRLANSICDASTSGIRFRRSRARWPLQHIYPFPGNPRVYICCGLTDYNRGHADGEDGCFDESGLIIYRLFVKIEAEEDMKQRRAALQATRSGGKQEVKAKRKPRLRQRVAEIEPAFWIKLQKQMEDVVAGQDEGARFVIIAPGPFYRQFVETPRMNRQIELMRVHGADARSNPVIGFRNLALAVGIVVGVTAVTAVVVIFAGALGAATGSAAVAAEASAAASAATAAETAAGAVLTGELALIRTAQVVAANDNAIALAKAAAVLLVVATVKDAKANPQVETVDAVMIVPESEFKRSADGSGTYKGKTYYWIADAEAAG